MTWREKFHKENPDVVVSKHIGGCPKDMHDKMPSECPDHCSDCWDREVPEEYFTADGDKVKIPDKPDPVVDIVREEVKAKYGIGKAASIPHIKDSGDRTQFASGAVRDMHEGKGRCDLLPLDVVGSITNNRILSHISEFQDDGLTHHLTQALSIADDALFSNKWTMFLEVAKHFEEGAKKYGDNNWRKGIPVRCYIDSAVRHYLKYLRGDKDEPHDRAFCWNILCAIWTCKHKPELNDYAREEDVAVSAKEASRSMNNLAKALSSNKEENYAKKKN